MKLRTVIAPPWRGGATSIRPSTPTVPAMNEAMAKLIETEDKLTADGYRKQLETNYALKLPPEQVTPFIDARFNIKGSAEYPRWLRAFVSSARAAIASIISLFVILTSATLDPDSVTC